MGKWLGVVDQSVFLTPVTPPTTFIDCVSLDLHPERESAEALSSNFIGPTSAQTGSYKIVGEVEIIPNSENILLMLKYLFGTPTVTKDGANARYLHKHLPSDTLKYGTMYAVDSAQPDLTNCKQYSPVIVTEMRLEAALNAYVSTRFTLLGRKDVKVVIPNVGNFSIIKQFHSIDGKMYWDIAGSVEETEIQAVSLTYTREIPDDFYSMNDFLLQGFIPGPAKLEGSVDLKWLNWTAYTKFWGGATGPVQAPARAAMSFDFKGPSLGGVTTYEFNRMKVLIPSVILPSIKEPFEGRGAITQTVEFKADRGTVGGAEALCEVDLVNALVGDYTP